MKVKVKNELLFRKAFVPWYDTEIVVFLTLVFAVVVLLFSFYGIAASLDTPRYTAFLWVPCLLGFLSLFVIVSLFVRSIRRDSNGSS